ncbi:restriction endonuclease subunit S [Piscinibacter sp. Jin2]|uniref:Restriction endonuclease subunit S n=1 Tax=Aquariibacter lacus TaxID=2801332 RepID=A0A9X1BQW6_9BURK|nr:restriction endonuclease subunit S [Piscinibacter lacus]
MLRNGRLFGHRVETGFPDLPILEVSLRTCVRVRDMENLKRKQVMSQKEKYKRAAKGDIAYNMMRMWQGAVGPAPVDGLVSPAYVVVKPYDEANSSYYSYLFRTSAYMQEVNKFSRGIVADRNRLYWESFKQMPSLVPPRPEQDQIVAYLRAQDAHIARFIKAKRELIKRLTEQKLRIIDHAVTRGLDSSVALKPSGIEWLGEMPEHWDASRLKYCVSRIHAGGTPDTGVDGYWSDSSDGIPWLLIADVTRADRVANSTKRLTQAGLESKRLAVVPAGAVLYTMYASIGKAAILGIDSAINQAILGLEPKSNLLEAEFLFFWLRSLERHIKNLASTSTQANLNAAKVKALPMFLPPLEEQKLICAWIKSECRIFDDAIARTEEEIKLIREYRDRLIADVVTGQVDVQGWQPSPDDVVAEEDLAALAGDEEIETEGEDNDGEE